VARERLLEASRMIKLLVRVRELVRGPKAYILLWALLQVITSDVLLYNRQAVASRAYNIEYSPDLTRSPN